MKRISLGLLLLALLTVPAHAEDKENPYVKTREQLKKEHDALDRQYQKTLDATRGALAAPAKTDPWANMRGADTSKTK